MTKDKLIIVEDHHGNYQIQWYLAEEQDTGATLGDECCRASEPLLLIWGRALDRGEVKDEDLEHCAATVGAASQKHTEMYPVNTIDSGFYWEHRSDAQQALALAKLRIKEAREKTPWPQWARDAVAHGWKAPKGWKP